MGLKKYKLCYTSTLYVEDNVTKEMIDDEFRLMEANITQQIEEFCSIKCGSIDTNLTLEEISENENCL